MEFIYTKLKFKKKRQKLKSLQKLISKNKKIIRELEEKVKKLRKELSEKGFNNFEINKRLSVSEDFKTKKEIRKEIIEMRIEIRNIKSFLYNEKFLKVKTNELLSFFNNEIGKYNVRDYLYTLLSLEDDKAEKICHAGKIKFLKKSFKYIESSIFQKFLTDTINRSLPKEILEFIYRIDWYDSEEEMETEILKFKKLLYDNYK